MSKHWAILDPLMLTILFGHFPETGACTLFKFTSTIVSQSLYDQNARERELILQRREYQPYFVRCYKYVNILCCMHSTSDTL